MSDPNTTLLAGVTLPPPASPTAETTTAIPAIEADEWANDSSYGDNEVDDGESTASITSSILKYRVENGRTYHAYKV